VLDGFARDDDVEGAIGERNVLDTRHRPGHAAVAVLSHAAPAQLHRRRGEVSGHEETWRAERIHQAAAADAEKIRQSAQREIEGAMKSARSELRAFVADHAVQMAEAIIRKEIRPEDASRMLTRYTEELGEVKR